MMSIKETDDKYVAHTYSRFPVELVSGKGAILQIGRASCRERV